MEFNDKWTKEVNDKYRQMIKEHRSYDEIKEYFGDELMQSHPKKKFSHHTVLSYGRFQALLNEISFYPNYIFFSYDKVKSIRFPNQKDYICNFNINNIDYIAILEFLIEDNNSFKNEIVYNVFFTTKLQYDKYNNIILDLSKEELEEKFKELQEIVEQETNYNDIIKIFNALSYILIKMSSNIENCIYMISETDDERKFNFYIKSIKDSFNNYELIVDESVYFPNRKSYYFKIKNKMEFERKFIDTIELDDWEVETDTGWSDIKAIGKTIEYEEWYLKTTNYELICADTHIVFNENFDEIFVKDLKVGDYIMTKNGPELVMDCYNTYIKSNMFDLELEDNNHRFYSNDILSHNSMWLNNIASNAANDGVNVLFITLEMSWRKVMKRLGSMRLKINVDEYEEKSKDTIFMKQRLNNLKSQTGVGNLFNSQPGKIFVKKYNTSDCTVTDIDNYIKRFEEVKRLKVGMVVVDYINIMSIEKGFDITNMLYLKGKHLAEGLRRIADKYECAVITATQTDKAVWGASDIKLADIPESKAIADTSDSVWGIIRNPEMKKNNVYRLKILKLRDGEHHEEQIRFEFNTKFLTMENETLVGAK